MAPFQMAAESLFGAQERRSQTLLRIPDRFAIRHTTLPRRTTQVQQAFINRKRQGQGA